MSMPKIHLPSLAKDITRLGLGALPMGPLQRNVPVVDGAHIVRDCVEGGITFIDTATLYGTYEHIAKGLAGVSGDITIATKTHAQANRAMAEEHIEMARAGLQRDCLDIMLCHCGRTLYTHETWGPTLDALMDARAKGKIKMVGLSSHSVTGVRIAASMPEIEVIHPLINMTGMGIVDGSLADMEAAIHDAHDAGKFIYAMKALAGGNLVPQREEALRYVWDNSDLDALVLGMVSPEEVQWNLNFFQGMPNPEELSCKTALHSKRLNILEFVCQGCGACVERCENDALSLRDGKAKVDDSKCILCGYCATSCPLFAIRMV